MDRTTLYQRVAHGYYNKVEDMLQQDRSRVNETEKTTYDNKTPLQAAIMRVNVRMVRILLAYGANPNMLTEAGDTPLSEVVSSVCYENDQNRKHGDDPRRQEPAINIALLLIQHGVDIEMRCTELQETPLISSVNGGFFELTNILLYHGAKINTRDGVGRTALMWAAFHGSERDVALLVQHGADISIEGLDGLNAEQLAFENADQGESFGEISANLRDRRLNMEKFDAFAMIHREEEQQSLVHLLSTDVIEKIREYA